MNNQIPEFSHIKKAKDTKKQFGILLKQIRINRKLTQKELGKLSNLSESQIGQYEIGIRKPKVETLLKITAALDISTDFFLALANYSLAQNEVDKLLHWYKNTKNAKKLEINRHSVRTDEEKKELDEILGQFLKIVDNPFTQLYMLEDEIERVENPPFDPFYADYEYLLLNDEGKKEVSKLVKKLLQNPKYVKKENE